MPPNRAALTSALSKPEASIAGETAIRLPSEATGRLNRSPRDDSPMRRQQRAGKLMAATTYLVWMAAGEVAETSATSGPQCGAPCLSTNAGRTSRSASLGGSLVRAFGSAIAKTRPLGFIIGATFVALFSWAAFEGVLSALPLERGG